jgi:peptide-methionine (R)-S-oxide reductase
VEKTEEEWKKTLSPLQYKVLREKGTERAFTGALLENHEKGVYTCAACGADLFASDTKFESGSGWPSFYAPIAEENVATEADNTLGMRRIEILCRRCGGHLGHVFNDGPKPTGVGREAVAWERPQPRALSRTIIRAKPRRAPMVGASVSPARWASGISSSTTTKIMAPAAKARA